MTSEIFGFCSLNQRNRFTFDPHQSLGPRILYKIIQYLIKWIQLRNNCSQSQLALGRKIDEKLKKYKLLETVEIRSQQSFRTITNQMLNQKCPRSREMSKEAGNLTKESYDDNLGVTDSWDKRGITSIFIYEKHFNSSHAWSSRRRQAPGVSHDD